VSSFKLLVVDDEADFGEFVAEVAEDMDFDVKVTDDPLQFASLYSVDIDVFVLDLFMPGVDGIELLRFLSDNKSKASIVFMSGKDMGVLHSAQELALEQGMSVLGTLQKPFRAEDLEHVLNRYVPYVAAQISENSELPSIDELRQAIEEDELFVIFQPQVDMTTREFVGVETLVRWKHPHKGMIPPGYFIPFAEEFGMISEVTTFVNKAAIRQLGDWTRQGLNIRLSVNMSPKILDDLDLPEKLAEYAEEVGARVPDIMIEVTETAVMLDVARYMDILARLRMKGFHISIDDFGTGYSSLQQLVRVPFTELKIDQAFIRKLDSDKDCRTIAEISVLLAHKLGMHVVAEGIEDENIWNIARDLGCDQGQGYWMGRPMPAEDIPAWLVTWSEG
jgi:EAL domain-containing protein (putative c-di-GMP-specific phosphodiesterase class I)